MKKQSQAVYEEVVKTLRTNDIPFVEGTSTARDILSKDLRETIVESIKHQLLTGAIALKQTQSNQKKLSDPKLLHNYANGLVSNWLNRDPRLNPNQNNTDSVTGIRKYAKDEIIQELKLVLSKVTQEDNQAGIEKTKEAIRNRIQELRTEETTKAKKEVSNLLKLKKVD